MSVFWLKEWFVLRFTKGIFAFGLIFMFLLSGCSSVKPYQKMYVNDRDMKLSSDDLEWHSINAASYREGASGANGGKAGGGCGCN